MSRRAIAWWPVAAATLVGAVLRAWDLDGLALSLDEIGEVMVAQRPPGPLLGGVRGHAGAAPLDYIGVKISTSLFGMTTLGARIWPWLVGTLAVPAVAWTAMELFRSKRPAILAAWLMALSPFAVYYAREVRFYSLSLLLAILLIGSFAVASRRGSPQSWLTFGLTVAAGLYAHYFIGLLAAACGVALLSAGAVEVGLAGDRLAAARRLGRSALGLIGAALLAAVLFLPWYAYAVAPQLGGAVPAGLPPLTLDMADDIVVGVLYPVGLTEISPPAWGWVRGLQVTTVLGFVTGLAANRLGATALLLIAIGILPAVWLADSQGGYFFHARQIIAVVAAVILLAAHGASALALVVARIVGTASAAGAVFVTLAAASALAAVEPLGAVYSGLYATREDWRGAAAYIESSACPDARVMVNVGEAYRYGIGFYAPKLMDQLERMDTVAGEALAETLERRGLAPSDWMVVLAYGPGAGGQYGIERLVRELTGRGYVLREFTWLLLVFEPPLTCGEG